MVVYLPTILMNTINQATNYIPTDDKYELIYTINSNLFIYYLVINKAEFLTDAVERYF